MLMLFAVPIPSMRRISTSNVATKQTQRLLELAYIVHSFSNLISSSELAHAFKKLLYNVQLLNDSFRRS